MNELTSAKTGFHQLTGTIPRPNQTATRSYRTQPTRRPDRQSKPKPAISKPISTTPVSGNAQTAFGIGNLRYIRKDTLKVIPLGGLGEIGKNMMVYEYGDDIIVVDMGIMFPEAEMLGIDYIIPDISYLVNKKASIKGVIFTHGHEDHIGSAPYLLPKLGQLPIYATKLTAGLLEAKLAEFEIKPEITLIKAGDKIKIGVFEIEFIPFAHTIPDDVALAIDTPVGKILHITDFKLDPSQDASRGLYGKLAALGKEGVKLLLLDSTNVERKGASTSESVVTETIGSIFHNAKGRIIVTSFASSIDRIQGVIDNAVRTRRKVAISGRSMEKTINIAMNLGYLRVPDNLIVDIRRIYQLPDNELVILATGSQGEEFSALVRMASGEHRHVKIKRGDTVVMSASAIPGNERMISNTVNNLFREGADVYYGTERPLHASGHAKREDLMLVIGIVKPDYFLPIHGEYRHLVLHARLAQQLGLPEDHTLVAEDGQVVEIDQSKAQILPTRVPAGYVLVDGLGVGDVGNIVLRDRQAMAKDGIFVVILTVDHRTGKILTSPDIISRGFVYMRAQEDLIQEARNEVKKMFARHNERYPLQWDYVKKMIREEMGELLFKKTERRPMVIPVVIEI